MLHLQFHTLVLICYQYKPAIKQLYLYYIDSVIFKSPADSERMDKT